MKQAQKFAAARGAGDAFLGVEVSWDLGDSATALQIPREQFEALFKAAGASPGLFDKPPTPESSLPLAARIGWSHTIGVDSGTISVKQLSRPDKDTPLAFGVYYRVSVEGERDRWELGARVRVEAGLVVVQPPQDADSFPSEAAQKWADAIADYANRCPSTVFNHEISVTLIAFGAQLGWVTRRSCGGVYFLPGEYGERFMQVLDGLEMLTSGTDTRVQFQGNATPQYADPRTLQTWQRRTVQTFDDEIVQLTAKLKDMTSRDNVRESSFDLRVAECAALLQRAEQYAAVLQEHLDPFKSALATLQQSFGDAQAKLREAKGRADTAFAQVHKLAQVTTAKAKREPQAAEPAKPAKTNRYDKSVVDRLFDVG